MLSRMLIASYPPFNYLLSVSNKLGETKGAEGRVSLINQGGKGLVSERKKHTNLERSSVRIVAVLAYLQGSRFGFLFVLSVR